ncbi:FGGY family carbohydrate kinase, partial [Vibrio campbellii]
MPDLTSNNAASNTPRYVVALDQGTTSSRAVILDQHANIVTVSQREFTQIYPKAGWVEHD